VLQSDRGGATERKGIDKNEGKRERKENKITAITHQHTTVACAEAQRSSMVIFFLRFFCHLFPSLFIMFRSLFTSWFLSSFIYVIPFFIFIFPFTFFLSLLLQFLLFISFLYYHVCFLTSHSFLSSYIFFPFFQYLDPLLPSTTFPTPTLSAAI
jgi:hypothetical protein